MFGVFGPVAHLYFSIRIHQNDGKELSYAVGSILLSAMIPT